jgi:hypothetical protein
MRHLLVWLALAAALLPAAHCGGADPVPSWHPHKLKRREGAPGVNASAAAGGGTPVATPSSTVVASSAGFVSTRGCGVLASPEWERRVCFDAWTPAPDALAAASAAGFVNVTLTLEVRVRSLSAGPDAAWVPACGDTLRLRLWSRVALAAPRAALALPAAPDPAQQQPGSCGRYAATLLLPPPGPQRAAYRADVRVVHVDGEGGADPPSPRLAPANLVQFKDGPPVWNLAARVSGALYVPAVGGGSGAQRPRRGEGFEAADGAWLRDIHRHGNETKLCAQRNCKRLPRCSGGDAPGAWHVHNRRDDADCYCCFGVVACI